MYDWVMKTAMPAVSKFAKSGLGQTLIGGGIGYGVDKLSGGKGGLGALAGAGLGLANAEGFGTTDAWSGSYLDKAIGTGGLGNFGAKTNKPLPTSMEGAYFDPTKIKGVPSTNVLPTSTGQGLKGTVFDPNYIKPEPGFLDKLSSYQKPFENSMKIVKPLSDMKSQHDASNRAEAELQMIQDVNNVNLATAADAKARREATQRSIDEAAKQSSFIGG